MGHCALIVKASTELGAGVGDWGTTIMLPTDRLPHPQCIVFPGWDTCMFLGSRVNHYVPFPEKELQWVDSKFILGIN